MADRTQRQYGLWKSAFDPQIMASTVMLTDVQWDTDGDTLVWHEFRSARGVLVCARRGEAARDLTPDTPVMAQVGYGGGDFAVADGNVYFVAASGRLCRQPLEPGQVVPLTPAYGALSSPAVSPDGRWVLYVYSYERQDGLAIVDTEGRSWPQKVASGEDFYMQPRWHPDGDRIAWISWNHPQMPWDGTTLNLANLKGDAEGRPFVSHVEKLAGSRAVAVTQPEFSPDGRYLAYTSDESGWNNLYLYDLQTRRHRPFVADRADTASWAYGARSYAFSRDGTKLYYLRGESGARRLWVYNLALDAAQEVQGALAAYSLPRQIAVSPRKDKLAFIASSVTVRDRVVTLGLADTAVRVWYRSSPESVPSDHFSQPEAVSWKTVDGTEVYGLYYPPHNPAFQSDGLPPLICLVHGGPTGEARAAYDIYGEIAQFLATRGYAVLAVNHRGSTGHGKAFMQLLRGHWGVYDVEDTMTGARYLADRGLVDEGKFVVMGGSAGGYTVLQSLVTHPGFFKAGVCLFGVSNLFTLAAETHKFEERYLDTLIGPLPQASALYRERSPIFRASKITDAMIVFQGEVDPVVPRAQSDEIVASLKARGVPHEYVVYPGEGHGWRKQETVADFYRRLDAFLRQHVIFA